MVAIISLPIAWITYQLNWIRERHQFFWRYQYNGLPMREGSGKTPWPLRLFGETPQRYLLVEPEQMEKAKELFPEASVYNAQENW
jgi:hypothetical protein